MNHLDLYLFAWVPVRGRRVFRCSGRLPAAMTDRPGQRVPQPYSSLAQLTVFCRIWLDACEAMEG